jgi:hypothetical protein
MLFSLIMLRRGLPRELHLSATQISEVTCEVNFILTDLSSVCVFSVVILLSTKCASIASSKKRNEMYSHEREVDCSAAIA